MYEKHFIGEAVRRSATTELDRRKLFTMLGIAGGTAAAATVLGGTAAEAAPANGGGVDDAAVLNFALNLEYLEAEFYLHAVTGTGLQSEDVNGSGTYGNVTGGHQVPFKSDVVRQYAVEIANDEREHVRFLRAALGGAKVSRPAISLDEAFTAAARAAGVVGPKDSFDAFADDASFLLAAFLFEDVGVTAYKGAAGLIANKTYLDAAAGILAVEAYHAGAIRANLYNYGAENKGVYGIVQKLSNARDLLDGKKDDDQGIRHAGTANITPTDRNGIAYGRTPGQVLDIVYLNTSKVPVKKGGFYPNGVNGVVAESAGSLGK